MTANPPKATNTDEYLATLPEAKREVLEQFREIVRHAAPGAEESFGYGMPAFKLGGKGLFWYAAWKTHYSVYPLTEAMEAVLPEDDGSYEKSDKGTLRFPARRELPAGLVERLVRARVEEVTGAA